MSSAASVPDSGSSDVRAEVLTYIAEHLDAPTALSGPELHTFLLICKWTNSLPGEWVAPLRIPLWRFAQVLGVSDRTVGQILKKLAKSQFIQREYETFRNEDGLITHSEVRVAPYHDPFVTESYPEPEPEKPLPVRCCSACGSERVNALHIVRFRCRDCGNIDEQALGPVPGLANPAGPVLVRSFPAPPPFKLHALPPPDTSEDQPAPSDGVGVPVGGVAHAFPKEPEPLPEPWHPWTVTPLPPDAARPWWPCDCFAWDWRIEPGGGWCCGACGKPAMCEGLPP
jgi:hypothetical protein